MENNKPIRHLRTNAMSSSPFLAMSESDLASVFGHENWKSATSFDVQCETTTEADGVLCRGPFGTIVFLESKYIHFNGSVRAYINADAKIRMSQLAYYVATFRRQYGYLIGEPSKYNYEIDGQEAEGYIPTAIRFRRRVSFLNSHHTVRILSPVDMSLSICTCKDRGFCCHRRSIVRCMNGRKIKEKNSFDDSSFRGMNYAIFKSLVGPKLESLAINLRTWSSVKLDARFECADQPSSIAIYSSSFNSSLLTPLKYRFYLSHAVEIISDLLTPDQMFGSSDVGFDQGCNLPVVVTKSTLLDRGFSVPLEIQSVDNIDSVIGFLISPNEFQFFSVV